MPWSDVRFESETDKRDRSKTFKKSDRGAQSDDETFDMQYSELDYCPFKVKQSTKKKRFCTSPFEGVFSLITRRESCYERLPDSRASQNK